jgi:hypothetical protein
MIPCEFVQVADVIKIRVNDASVVFARSSGAAVNRICELTRFVVDPPIMSEDTEGSRSTGCFEAAPSLLVTAVLRGASAASGPAWAGLLMVNESNLLASNCEDVLGLDDDRTFWSFPARRSCPVCIPALVARWS